MSAVGASPIQYMYCYHPETLHCKCESVLIMNCSLLSNLVMFEAQSNHYLGQAHIFNCWGLHAVTFRAPQYCLSQNSCHKEVLIKNM